MIETTLTVALGERSYPIYIGQDLYCNLEILRKHLLGSQVFIVSNNTVAPLYLSKLQKMLADEFQVDIFLLQDGEEYKTLSNWQKVIDELIEKKHHRNTTVIALGGGVVGDVAGFVAACYQRGANFIQIPTTLLAQVDASVGGKTAVNHDSGKNMIGAFYQPQAVLIDTDVLSTLPDREYIAGLAETIKYGFIYDKEFFEWCENNIDNLLERQANAIVSAVKKSCEIKAKIVAKDEKESGVRAILNFGHTFAHAIEAATEYKQYLHGEAVAIGMLMASKLSLALGEISEQELGRAQRLIDCLAIKTDLNHSPEELYQLMSMDKKNVTDQPRFILLDGIGCAKVVEGVGKQLVLDVLVV